MGVILMYFTNLINNAMLGVSLLGGLIGDFDNKILYATAANISYPINRASYSQSCKAIDRINSWHTKGLTIYLMLAHRGKQHHAIKKYLQSFKSNLLKKEQEALFAIKNKFNINQIHWDNITHSIENLKTIYQEAMKNKSSVAQHSSLLPLNIRNDVCKTLEDNGIDPQSINLIILQNKSDTLLARAYTTISYNNTSGFKFDPIYHVQNIEFSPAIFTECEKYQKSIYIHEIEHLIQHHNITCLVLESYITQVMHISHHELQISHEYMALQKIHEEQADIFPALRSSEFAQCMLLKRSRHDHELDLSAKHYHTLLVINSLWAMYPSAECLG